MMHPPCSHPRLSPTPQGLVPDPTLLDTSEVELVDIKFLVSCTVLLCLKDVYVSSLHTSEVELAGGLQVRGEPA